MTYTSEIMKLIPSRKVWDDEIVNYNILKDTMSTDVTCTTCEGF